MAHQLTTAPLHNTHVIVDDTRFEVICVFDIDLGHRTIRQVPSTFFHRGHETVGKDIDVGLERVRAKERARSLIALSGVLFTGGHVVSIGVCRARDLHDGLLTFR